MNSCYHLKKAMQIKEHCMTFQYHRTSQCHPVLALTMARPDSLSLDCGSQRVCKWAQWCPGFLTTMNGWKTKGWWSQLDMQVPGTERRRCGTGCSSGTRADPDSPTPSGTLSIQSFPCAPYWAGTSPWGSHFFLSRYEKICTLVILTAYMRKLRIQG